MDNCGVWAYSPKTESDINLVFPDSTYIRVYWFNHLNFGNDFSVYFTYSTKLTPKELLLWE